MSTVWSILAQVTLYCSSQDWISNSIYSPGM